MRISRRRFLHLATGAALLPAIPSVASAQAFPSRPVTIIVPFPAGGPADVIARIVGDRMRTSLGQPVIVENVSGAGGTIGVARAARAAPDGYTLSMGQLNSHVFSGAAYTVRYDLLKDFEPVALLTTNPLMIAGRKDLSAKNIRELVAWLKANPDKASFARPESVAHRMFGVFTFRTAQARVSSSWPIEAPALRCRTYCQLKLT